MVKRWLQYFVLNVLEYFYYGQPVAPNNLIGTLSNCVFYIYKFSC